MSKVGPELLVELHALTEQAAHYNRHAVGSRSRKKQRDEGGRSHPFPLSNHLLLIEHMVECHFELNHEHQKVGASVSHVHLRISRQVTLSGGATPGARGQAANGRIGLFSV